MPRVKSYLGLRKAREQPESAVLILLDDDKIRRYFSSYAKFNGRRIDDCVPMLHNERANYLSSLAEITCCE